MSGAATGSSETAGRRFHLKRRLGAGAFGEVYLADMVSSGGFRRKVAIKLLHAEVARNKGAARRMRDEARILGHLAHRNIVSVLDLTQLGDRWAVIMDYLPGADLDQVLARCREVRKPPPIGAVFEIGAGVARALDAAWSSDDGQGNPLRVVHRDIKPSNVRLTPDGEVKVLDFGVARVEMDNREAATREAGWIGTERYMAPERIALLGDSPAGDVYALGATLIELLTGRPLGRTPVLPDKHKAMVDESMTRLKARLADAPHAAQALDTLAATVAAEPEDRPTARALVATFSELVRRFDGPSLAAFASEIVPPLISDDPGELVDQVLAETRGPTTGDSATLDAFGLAPEEPPRRSNLALVGAGAAVTVLVVVIGLVGVAAVAGGIAYYSLSNAGYAATETGAASGAGAAGQRGGATTGGASGRGDGGAADATAGTGTDVSGAGQGSAAGGASGQGDGGAADSTGATAGNPNGTDVSGADQSRAAGGASGHGDGGAADSTGATAGTSTGTAEASGSRQPGTAVDAVGTPSSPLTKGTGTSSGAPSSAAVPAVSIDPDAPRVRAIKVVFPEGSSLAVTCGDKAGSGTTSVAMRDLPAGSCTAQAVYLGRPLTARFQVSRPAEIVCTIDQEALACAPR